MLRKKSVIAIIAFLLSYSSIFLLNLIPAKATTEPEPTTVVSSGATTQTQNEISTEKSKELKPLDYDDKNIFSENNIVIYTDDTVSKTDIDKYVTLIKQIDNPYNSKICFVKMSSKPLNTYTPASLGAACYYDTASCTLYICSDKYSSEEFYYCVGEALDRNKVYSDTSEWRLLSMQLQPDFPEKNNQELFATAVMLYYTDYDNLAGYKECHNYISMILSERS